MLWKKLMKTLLRKYFSLINANQSNSIWSTVCFELIENNDSNWSNLLTLMSQIELSQFQLQNIKKIYHNSIKYQFLAQALWKTQIYKLHHHSKFCNLFFFNHMRFVKCALSSASNQRRAMIMILNQRSS